MRISYFVPRCTPDNSHGRYIIELAKRFSPHHDVTVFAGSFSPHLRSLFRCHQLPVLRRPAILRLASLWAASEFATRLRPADIVHNQGADAPICDVVTAQFCNQAMRRVAGNGVDAYRRFNYAIGAAVEKYCMSKSSTRRIIAVSNRVKAEVEREYGVDPDKVIVIHHGVDHEAFHPRNMDRLRDTARASLGLTANEFVVLFVGGDHRRKGLSVLLEAVKGFPPRVVVVAVEVKPDAALIRLQHETRLEERLSFTGSSNDIISAYAAADCFVLPTRYDTFSMATLEAMSCGLPVIVSRAAGVSEILSPGNDSLVLEDCEDVQGLVSYLGQLVNDESLRVRLGSQARMTAERNSWDSVASRTLDVYREILGSA